MSFLYWNCGSGLPNKLHVIDDLLATNRPQAFFIAESDLLDSRLLNVFTRKGYTFSNSSTLSSRGKSRLSCWYDKSLVRATALEDPFNEIIVLRSIKSDLTIVGVYHPFKCYQGESIHSNFVRLCANLERVSASSGKIIVVGDFNIHYNSVDNCPLKFRLEDWANEFALDQLVNFITRSRIVNNLLQTSTIDLLFTNLPGVNVAANYNSLSDHVVIEFKITTWVPKVFVKKTVEYSDWRNYSREGINERFLHHFGDCYVHGIDPEAINEKITNAICLSLNDLVPKRSTTIRGTDPVISPTIQNLKNKKSRIYKKWTRTGNIAHYDELKIISQRLNKAIRLKRKNDLLSNLNGDMKSYWNTINKVMGKDNAIEKTGLEIDGAITHDKNKIANAFIDYFSSKVENLNESFEGDHFTVPNLYEGLGTGELFNMGLFFSRDDVNESLKLLKRKKSVGFDEIPGIVVCDLTGALTTPLTWLFNSIMEHGKIPTAWKFSRIIPVFKKGNKHLPSNYRPISNTSTLSKVFEKCMIIKLMSRFDNDLLMGTHQNAYRQGASTVTACLAFQDLVSSNLDQGDNVMVYSTDLTSAFDLLRPNLMVKTLLELNIPKQMILVIYDFLTNRWAFADVLGSFSDVKSFPIGCVQGSVMGPFLFNIYTNKLENVIKSCDPNAFVVAYADDAYIGLPFKPDQLESAKQTVSRIFESHAKWLTEIGMICNFAKTELIIFGFNGPGWSMTLSGSTVRTSDNLKVLGVTFDKKLKWGMHVALLIKKINALTYSLRILNKVLPRFLHKMVINAFVLSHMSYAAPVWAGCLNANDVRRLNSLLYKVMRVHLFDFHRELTRQELCSKSGIRNFNSLRIVSDSVMLHKLTKFPEFNTTITLRMIEQTTFHSRYPQRPRFFDASIRKYGRSSFINRSKRISEFIPFDWPDLSTATFKNKMKSFTPLFIA